MSPVVVREVSRDDREFRLRYLDIDPAQVRCPMSRRDVSLVVTRLSRGGYSALPLGDTRALS